MPTNQRAQRRRLPEPLSEILYAHQQNVFWVKNEDGGFIQMDTASVKRYLKVLGIRARPPESGGPSSMDRTLVRIQREQDVQYAGALAGYRMGVHEIMNNRILVTESPTFIEPRAGGWLTIQAFLEGLLKEGTLDQTPYLYGWLKTAVEALRAGAIRPGQALVLAGNAGAGKSLLQNLITEMLGGRIAKPYQFMTGTTSFNAELFRAEHLAIEDEASSTDIRTRRKFGAMIKNLIVNEVQSCNQKFCTPVSLKPFWRISITVNDEPEHLLVLPPIDGSLEDKFILLKAHLRQMPMPTGSNAQRRAFWDTLISEIPGFLHFLMTWEIPQDLRSERYGVRAYHHPELLAAIDELSPEVRFLTIVDAVIFANPLRKDFECKAIDLERRLTDQDSGLAHQARALLHFYNACSTYLTRLSDKKPDRVTERRVHGLRLWKITPPRPAVVCQSVSDFESE
jgi:hypothetical protein